MLEFEVEMYLAYIDGWYDLSIVIKYINHVGVITWAGRCARRADVVREVNCEDQQGHRRHVHVHGDARSTMPFAR